MRLPNPTFCPHPIENLIKRCFYEAPNKRPTFKQIKAILMAAFNDLISQDNSKSKTNVEENPKRRYCLARNKCDNIMKSRYTLIKKGNIQETRTIGIITNEAEDVTCDDKNNLPTKYDCTHDAKNFGSNLNAHKSEDTTENYLDVA